MGEDVESILHKLYMESGQDIERCQRGIVYLDEIDKVGGTTRTRLLILFVIRDAPRLT